MRVPIAHVLIFLIFVIITIFGSPSQNGKQHGGFAFSWPRFRRPFNERIWDLILGGEPSTPASGTIKDVSFWHFLPGEVEGREITVGCSDCTAQFIANVPLVIIVHGFGSNHTKDFGTSLRAGFSKRSENFNLVFVDWSHLTPMPLYTYAVGNIQAVGEYTAALINFLVEQGTIDHNDNIYYVGHSLGSHVANYVSANLMASRRLNRIFALDPAQPLFDEKDDLERLDPADADFVLAIHTSIDFLGFEGRRGHVDFYPNSGRNQPGCPPDNTPSKCSHSRSYFYMAESIALSDAFMSCKCKSWEEFDNGSCSCQDAKDKVIMGWDTPTTASGTFYLRTNEKYPFGKG